MAEPDGGPFRDLTPDQALAAARAEGKNLVVVDVFTQWCGPCRKLDEITWRDPAVRAFLEAEAVGVKVDADKDRAFAEARQVNAYPSILLLRPDGDELDRLVGYRDAATFLEETRDALAGGDSLSRARRKLAETDPNAPMLRMSLADVLAEKGRNDEALAEYLWCFDHGLEHDRAFFGVRLSFLLGRIVSLAATHGPAFEALRARRDALRAGVEGGSAGFEDVMAFAALNTQLGDTGLTLEVYDRVKRNDAVPPRNREYLFEQSLDELLAARRYREVVDSVDPVATIRKRIELFERGPMRDRDDERYRGFLRRTTAAEGAEFFEALVGVGEAGRAAEVEALLADYCPSEAYPALAGAARRAGDTVSAERLDGEAVRLAGGARDGSE